MWYGTKRPEHTPAPACLNLSTTNENLPTTAAASASIAATTSATGAGCAAFGFRTRFIHIQSAAAHLVPVEGGNSLFAVLGIRHFDETEAARTARVAVRHDGYAIDLSVLLKQLAELVFPSVETEIPNEDVFHAKASVNPSYLNLAVFGGSANSEASRGRTGEQFKRGGSIAGLK
jgi:hypothetical protein